MDTGECAIQIRDKIYQQILTQSCRTSLKRSSQCITRICINDHHHVAFIHTSTCISLRSDLVHMVKNMKIAYGRSWKLRRRNWTGKVRKLGYCNQTLVYGSMCSELLAGHTGIWKPYVIYPSENMRGSGSEIQRLQSFWMQLIIHTNDMLAANNNNIIMCIKV
jgi:hypothetical protein